MKKLFLIVLLAPTLVFAQKAPKPNTNKILSLYQSGKYKEAKEQADVTIIDPKLSTDGKAWYYRGLVYATLDTIQDESLQALDANARTVAIESFKKAEEFNKKGTEYFIQAPGDIMPIQKTDQLTGWANYYLSKSIDLIQQDEPDYEGSYTQAAIARTVFENTLIQQGGKYVNDTLTYYIQAWAAINATRYDSAEEAALKYQTTGGKSSDVYLILFQIYSEKEDMVKALASAKEARKKFPNNADFKKNELNVYLMTKQYDVAKAMVEGEVQTSPSLENYYMLGELNRELKNAAEALNAYKKALEFDANHFESNAGMADLTYALVQEIRNQRNESKDNEKRRQLYVQIEQKLKESLPYWERLELLKPNEENVLYGLQSIYNDLSVYDEAKYATKIKRLKAKMKVLGLEVD